MTYRKKLIEVALPLEAINAASAREKSIRHGHPSTLHLWWARRPLAACRAVLFASLVDDPSSDPMFGGDEDIEASKRAELFNLIEELVQWENSNNPRVINKARAEIARCVASRKIETGELKKDQMISVAQDEGGKASKTYTPYDIKQMLASPEAVNHFLATYGPPVLDPFCGGGSIPLEAQRLGLRARGSDLNPVAVLINKALIEIPPKFAEMPPVNPEWQRKSREEKAATVWQGAQGLAEDVRYYGKWMRDEAEKRIGHLYPKVKITKEMAKDRPDLKEYVGQELTVIAWLWARTVASPNPACGGAHVPLVRSFWLSTKKERPVWVHPVVDRASNTYKLEIRTGKPPKEFDPGIGTTARNRRVCLLTGEPMPLEYVRSEAASGRMGVRLMAVVAEGVRERLYLPPDDDYVPAAIDLAALDVPDTDLVENARYMTPTIYGMTKHRHLFTPRQLVTLATLCDLTWSGRDSVIEHSHGNVAYADAIATYLAIGVSKLADNASAVCSWHSGAQHQKIRATFGRQALPMVWDYAEGNPFSDSTGNFLRQLELISRVMSIAVPPIGSSGVCTQVDAASCVIDARTVISSDPPYYDNVPYADLSDFFYIWLRHCLFRVYPQLFSTLLVPKAQELVADPIRNGGKDAARAFFEQGMNRVFRRLRDGSSRDYPATVYYAFKQSEDNEECDEDTNEEGVSRASTGWETFLQGLKDAGWQIGGTWPMRTELGNRMRNLGSNALASSIVLVCRPRSDDSPLATRREFVAALRRELPEALRNLQRGNIAPVDLAQASIGPGMAVFSRFSRVMETDGSAMTVRTALGLINQTLDEVLAEQEGEFDTDTRWALAWFEQFGMNEGAFGEADVLARAKNTAVSGLVEAGIVKARGGKVQLLKREELPDDWEPSKDKRLTIWEATQYLIRALDRNGESGAAALLRNLGGLGETARDLAYRLYTICERKKWADEALAYNGLVIAWSELTKLALAERAKPTTTQTRMFE